MRTASSVVIVVLLLTGIASTTFAQTASPAAGTPLLVDVSLSPAPAPPKVEPLPASPPPAPPAPPKTLGPPVDPRTTAIPAFLEKNFIGREPQKDSQLGCTSTGTATLHQLRE